MEIRDDDDDEDDHIHTMQGVQEIPPTPSVVALLPRTDPPAPIPIPHEHPNPMLVSLVPMITFGSGPDLMGTGSSQIVNVRPPSHEMGYALMD